MTGDADARVRVTEVSPGCKMLGQRAERLDIAAKRVVSAAVIDVRPVVETGGHRQQMSKRQGSGGLSTGHGAGWNVRRDWNVELEFPLLDQGHHDDRVEEFR